MVAQRALRGKSGSRCTVYRTVPTIKLKSSNHWFCTSSTLMVGIPSKALQLSKEVDHLSPQISIVKPIENSIDFVRDRILGDTTL